MVSHPVRDAVRNLKKILVLGESSNKKSRRSLGESTSVQVTEITHKIGCFIVLQIIILNYSLSSGRDVSTTICDVLKQRDIEESQSNTTGQERQLF